MKTNSLLYLVVISTTVAAAGSAFIPTHHQSLSTEKESSIAYKNFEDQDNELVVVTKPLDFDNSLRKAKRPIRKRTKWGVDIKHEDEYWFDSRIHTLGNIGFGGAFHAALAPLFTKLIDINAYNSMDVRLKVAEELAKNVRTSKARVLDLCCGVGTSTRALQEKFPNAEAVIGLDTSREMLAMAQFLTHHLVSIRPRLKEITNYTKLSSPGYNVQNLKSPHQVPASGNCPFRITSYREGNAENTPFPARSFDLVTVMYGFHEAPFQGRQNILKEAHRLLQPGGLLAVVDITTDYKPAPSMLAGEPYVLEYQKNIHKQMRSLKGFVNSKYEVLVPGHVGMWVLKRSPVAF